jgi:hypothetical protein
VARQREIWNAAHRRFKRAHPGRAAANQRAWAKSNPEKARESARKYRQTHPAEITRKAHERYWAEKARAKARQSRAACADRERMLRHAEKCMDLGHDASTQRETTARRQQVQERVQGARADNGLERSREQRTAEKERGPWRRAAAVRGMSSSSSEGRLHAPEGAEACGCGRIARARSEQGARVALQRPVLRGPSCERGGLCRSARWSIATRRRRERFCRCPSIQVSMLQLRRERERYKHGRHCQAPPSRVRRREM